MVIAIDRMNTDNLQSMVIELVMGGSMIELIGQKWKGFIQTVNNWLLTMDADPLQDIHLRVRRLEAAIAQMEAGRLSTGPDRAAVIEGEFGL
jgi:hypothetical protein